MIPHGHRHHRHHGHHPHPDRRRRPTGGFTLTEILIVMGIIGLLAIALLPNVLGAGKQAAETETKVRIQYLAGIADAFERRTGFYPPDDFVALGTEFPEKPRADAINPGIESFLIFTHLKKLGSQSLEGKESWFSNTDNDDAGLPIPLLSTSKKQEVLDRWGTPLAYFCAAPDGYSRVQRIRREDGEEVQARAWKNPKTGAYLDLRKYQIISAGADRVFNTEDDLVHPEVR